MGFPADKVEGIYRNPLSEVVRFLDTLHGEHYKLYNLCSERNYDPIKFKGRVASYPFDDHNPPPLSMIDPMMRDVDEFLAQSPENVVAIHCKAGKGRTGTMISCYLMFSNQCNSANAALQLFGNMRTHNGQGVTIPSQQRYVYYYEKQLKEGVLPPTPLILKKIVMHTIPNFGMSGGCEPFFSISKQGQTVFFSKPMKGLKNLNRDVVEFICDAVLIDDVKLEFFNKGYSNGLMFRVWFNTAFVKEDGTLTFWKRDCDGAIKDKLNKHFSPTFKLELFFENVNNSSSSSSSPGSPSTSSAFALTKPSFPTLTNGNSSSNGKKDVIASSNIFNPALARNDSSSNNNSAKELGGSPCAACSQLVSPLDFSIVIDNKLFHMHCAFCSSCGTTLTGKQVVITKDSLPICTACCASTSMRHSVSISFENCVKCNQSADKGPVNVIGGKTWHRACIHCVICQRNLQWAGYREVSGNPQCPEGCDTSSASASGSATTTATTKPKNKNISVKDSEDVAMYSDDEGNEHLETNEHNHDANSISMRSSSPSSASITNNNNNNSSTSGNNGFLPRASMRVCCVCYMALGHRNDWHLVDGKSVCDLDYNILLADACAGCHQPIASKSVSALGRRWHVDHLICSVCGVACGLMEFECDDASKRIFCPAHKPPVCNLCLKVVLSPPEAAGSTSHKVCEDIELTKLQEAFQQADVQPRQPSAVMLTPVFVPEVTPPAAKKKDLCVRCKKEFSTDNDVVEISGDRFHHHCRPKICARCDKGILGEFLDVNGKSYHQTCFSCSICSKPLMGQFLEAGGGLAYHFDCFVCAVCKKPFAGSQFIQRDGKNYCVDDFNNLFSPRCKRCNEAIQSGRFYTVGDYKYHEACFMCEYCNQHLSDGKHYPTSKGPCCQSCLSKNRHLY